MKLSAKLTAILEEHGFSIDYYDDGDILFSKFSPAGQNFNIEVGGDDLHELSVSIWNYYEGFDVSYETYLWLDEMGHGKNGAPYNMKDLYEDMEACEEIILELYELIKEEI